MVELTEDILKIRSGLLEVLESIQHEKTRVKQLLWKCDRYRKEKSMWKSAIEKSISGKTV